MPFVNGGELRLREDAGTQWDTGDHYIVLVKNAHTPALTDVEFDDLTNICDSANYSHQDTSGKVFLSTGAADLDNPDFTSGGTNTMVARYAYLLEGNVAGSSSTDKVIGYWDFNPAGGVDVNIDGALQVPASGVFLYNS